MCAASPSCHPGIPEALRGTFAGLAHPVADRASEARLGVTAVEVHAAGTAWIEERHLCGARARPTTGATTPMGNVLAPDPQAWHRAAGPEVRAAVAALAAAGIETLVDIVLNHTGEGDARRGHAVTARARQRAVPTASRAERAVMWTSTTRGCGNTLAAGPAICRCAWPWTALRAWAAARRRARLSLRPGARRWDAPDRRLRPRTAPLLTGDRAGPAALTGSENDRRALGHRHGAAISSAPSRRDWGEWNNRYPRRCRVDFWRGDGGRLGRARHTSGGIGGYASAAHSKAVAAA